MGVTWSLDLRPALVSTGNLFVPAAAFNWRALHYFIPHVPSPDRLRRAAGGTVSRLHPQPTVSLLHAHPSLPRLHACPRVR
jgi:hypothetical protein